MTYESLDAGVAISGDGATSAERNAAGFWKTISRPAGGFCVGGLQILGLWGLNLFGMWVAKRTAVPIPGNLLGMVALYALLALGVVKIAWFEAAGFFLIRHLAFFFVPITVGLMQSGGLLAAHGLGIIVTLAVSAAIGIALAGSVSQLLLRTSLRRGARR